MNGILLRLHFTTFESSTPLMNEPHVHRTDRRVVKKVDSIGVC